MPSKLKSPLLRVWTILRLAADRFFFIDGAQRAGAFAFSAFFSLFPLIILFVTIASVFISYDTAGKAVIGYAERYVPLSGEMQRYIFDTIVGVVKARSKASATAFLMLLWAAPQFFTTLVTSANRAWGTEADNWWHQPLKSISLLFIMVCAVLMGIGLSIMAKVAHVWLSSVFHYLPWIYKLGAVLVPWTVIFVSLALFYKLAPWRRTRFSEIWPGALCATALLQISETLFVVYLKHFAALNAVYGAFGGIIALLLWIYLSGCVFIFGACLCAAQAETRGMPDGLSQSPARP
ncbi:MAG: YihY/virulence factor BrkB family protein [Elusimicrobiota bacterium]